MIERARYSAPPVFREAVVVVGGPALSLIDVARAMEWRDASPVRGVVAVGNAYRAAPTADVLYAAEKHWFDAHAVDAARRFSGQVWTGCETVAHEWPTVRLVRRVDGDRLPDNGICVGGPVGSSDLQAICFAALCGSLRIGVLGYGGAPEKARHPAWRVMVARANMQLRARGVAVANLSPESEVDSFDRLSLTDWIGGT